MYDIITTGSATVDVFAHTESQLVKFLTNHGEDDFIAFPSGSKILINSLDFKIGGGGTNTAVSFSRLGLHTAYLGKLGDDTNAQKVLNLLHNEHIDFIGVQAGQTGYSIILDTLDKDRTILTFKGANNELRFEELDTTQIHARWLYASSLTGTSQHTLDKLVDFVQQNNIKFAFNPSNYQARQGYKALQHIVDACSVLVMNKEEIELLFDVANTPQLFFDYLRAHPQTYLVITDGPRGASCHYQGETYLITPSPHQEVVETTGAGDAFASGFVAGLAGGMTLPESLTLGMVQAESVIGVIGAKENLLIKEVALQRMSQFSGKLTHHKDLIPPYQPKKKIAETDGLPQFYEASKDRAFIFDNHSRIAGLEELGYYLKFIDEATFKKHVGEGYNHFADWIEGVFGLDSLSQQLRSTQDKTMSSNYIITFVHRGGTHEN